MRSHRRKFKLVDAATSRFESEEKEICTSSMQNKDAALTKVAGTTIQ